jgi:hypothetical protein
MDSVPEILFYVIVVAVGGYLAYRKIRRIRDFSIALSRIDEAAKGKKDPYGTFLVRLGFYALMFAVAMVIPIVQMKTGIPMGRSAMFSRGPFSWPQVWAELPDTALFGLSCTVPIFLCMEWWIRWGRKKSGNAP